MNLVDEFLRDTVELCSVAAPTGREEARGRELAARLSRIGVDCGTDAAGNVVGEIPGRADLPAVAYVAHLDTVFPDEGPIEVRREGRWLCAPGIGDNSSGLAALLALARELPRDELGPVLLVASVGEEGIGDLRGARHLVRERGEEIDVFLAIEGAMRDRIVTAGMGSERLRATVRGPGGHSWGDAGVPSAIDVAARLVAALYGLALPRAPKTTLNVGTIRGGNSINSIAETATFDVDLRSLDRETVLGLRDHASALLRRGGNPEGIRVTVEGIGSRPAGALPEDHPLLGHLRRAREEVGLPPAVLVTSSTDANVPLAAGIPAAAVGVAFGEDAHKRTERLSVDGVEPGLRGLLAAARRIGSDPNLCRRAPAGGGR